MGDLIDRAAALEALGEKPFNWNDTPEEQAAVREYNSAYNAIARLPAVEAVPVVHGKWIVKEMELWQECSVCGVAVEVDSMYMCKASEDMNFNYCPHCGAKMEG